MDDAEHWLDDFVHVKVLPASEELRKPIHSLSTSFEHTAGMVPIRCRTWLMGTLLDCEHASKLDESTKVPIRCRTWLMGTLLDCEHASKLDESTIKKFYAAGFFIVFLNIASMVIICLIEECFGKNVPVSRILLSTAAQAAPFGYSKVTSLGYLCGGGRCVGAAALHPLFMASVLSCPERFQNENLEKTSLGYRCSFATSREPHLLFFLDDRLPLCLIIGRASRECSRENENLR
jgi:hypothetical protein